MKILLLAMGDHDRDKLICKLIPSSREASNWQEVNKVLSKTEFTEDQVGQILSQLV